MLIICIITSENQPAYPINLVWPNKKILRIFFSDFAAFLRIKKKEENTQRERKKEKKENGKVRKRGKKEEKMEIETDIELKENKKQCKQLKNGYSY